MKKSKILLIASIIIVAAVVIFFVIWSNMNSTTGENTQKEQERESVAEAIAGEFSEQEIKDADIVIIDNDQQEHIDANSEAEIYTENKELVGKQVKISGSAYTEPEFKDHLLSFVIDAGGGHFAFVVMYDENQQVKVSKGEKISIEGILSGYTAMESVEAVDGTIPMINAQNVALTG